MISSLILLSATVFATPVYISDVQASREAGHLRVEVRGDGGIDPDAARTVIDEGRLVIYLGGARVRADNRSWELKDGAGEIRAHRHKTETELVVPLTDNGCSGPVELTGSATGITALVGCEGAVSLAPKKRASAQVKTSTKTAGLAVALKKLVELPDEDEPEAAEPKVAPPVAAVVPATKPVVVEATRPTQPTQPAQPKQPDPTPLPLHRVESASAAPPAAVRAASTGAAPVTAQLPRAKPTASVVTVPTAVTARSAATQSTAATEIPGTGIPAGTGSSLKAVFVPGFLLAALALAAYLFARRRRGTSQRHIEILETTSLGPKRSLVVARIGGETIILGSSEAGITLLKGNPSVTTMQMAQSPELANLANIVNVANPAPPPPGPAAKDHAIAVASVAPVSELDQPIEEALADIPEPDSGRGGRVRGGFRAIEGGLAGLFHKRGGNFERNDEGPVFDDLLEDSIEDQELRRKLAAGLSSRVR